MNFLTKQIIKGEERTLTIISQYEFPFTFCISTLVLSCPFKLKFMISSKI